MAAIRSRYFRNASKTDAGNATVQTIRRSRHIKVEYDEHNEEKPVKNKRKKRASAAVENETKIKIKAEPDEKSEHEEKNITWEPNNWKEVYSNIKEMRRERNAVVDTQGCERLSDMHETPEVIRYQTLVSLMLSSQTRDQITAAAMGKLKTYGLNVPNIIGTEVSKIEELIKPVGFYKRKAQYLKQASLICHEKYNNDIPNNLKELLTLPGVGPKMAHICMNAAWGEVTGIGVDTHVHRISNWLKLVPKPTKTPEDTRKALESWLPRSDWMDFNILLVGFGQQTCLPVRPKCDICLNKDICPASKAKTKVKVKVKEEIPE